jgi:hypothetical protein
MGTLTLFPAHRIQRWPSNISAFAPRVSFATGDRVEVLDEPGQHGVVENLRTDETGLWLFVRRSGGRQSGVVRVVPAASVRAADNNS